MAFLFSFIQQYLPYLISIQTPTDTLNTDDQIKFSEIIPNAKTYFSNLNHDEVIEQTLHLSIYLGVFIAILLILKILYKYLVKWILKNENFIYKITSKLKIYRLKEEDKENAIGTFLQVIKWVYRFFIFIAAYIMVPFILSVSPFTETYSNKMFGYILNPFVDFFIKFLHYIPTLIKILVILFIFSKVIKLVSYFFKEVEKGNINLHGFHKDWSGTTSKMIKFVLYAFIITLIFPLLPGANSDIFKGVTMFLGLLLSLGSTSVISNAMSGLIMTYMRPFKIGDRIEVNNITGIVVMKNTIVTRVRTPKNVIVTIPNANILSGYSKNFSTAAERSNLIIHTSLTIGYDVDWRKVHDLLNTAAINTEGIINDVPEKRPFVLQTSLDDFYVTYEINAYISNVKTYNIIESKLYGNILDEFNNANVEIMSPHYQANRVGNDITIPKTT